METSEINELEVKGVSRPIQKKDAVAYVKDSFRYQGRVQSIRENGDMELKIYNSKDIKSLIVPKGEAIEPMFYINKEQKTVEIKFTYEEVSNALSSNKDLRVDSEAVKKQFTNLRLGNKTAVLPFQKTIEDNLAPVEGRLEMKRDYKTGAAFIDSDVKFKELNLDRPIYGKSLDEAQKEQLKKTGELGLVDGFRKADGSGEYKLWVALDASLNKVITARENEIYVNKIFGVTLNENQLQDVRSGKGTLLEVNGKNWFFQPSAAATQSNRIKSFTEEKAREFKLIPEEKQEKKNDKSKGVRL